jgi:phosphoribosylpyrophosphate synthetase
MELAGADRFVTMDLHAPQLQGFWKKNKELIRRF